jgi:trigger factor
MDYQVEDISPVKKKVNVQVPAEEVNASLETTIALFRKDLKLDGFRKGKVPASIVEQRFGKDIYNQAGQDLLNVHFNQIFGELDLEPISGVDVDAGDLVRDKDFSYSFQFEVRPDVELPEYRGLKATKRKVGVSDEMVDRMLSRMQRERSELALTDEDRNPQDGDVAVIDFAAYQNGEPLENIHAEKFELPLGEGQSLQGFEGIVKGLVPGETGEGEVTFPDDFINPDLSGQKATMRVTLNMIKERKLPEINDEFAQGLGYQTVQELRDGMAENIRSYLDQTERNITQKKLLDQLVSQVDVELPESLLEGQLQRMIDQRRQNLERQGKSLDAEGGEDKVREDLLPEAKELVKAHIVLLAIAKREELTVSNQEIERHIYRQAMNSGQDPQSLREYYQKNNLMHALRDSLLADKAVDLIYENAAIEEVDPESEDQGQERESGTEPSEEVGAESGSSDDNT